MRLIFSAESYPSPEEPATAFIAVLCREMTRQGHEVTVIAPQSLRAVLSGRAKKRPYHYIDIVRVGNEDRSINIYCPFALTSGFGRLGKVTTWSRELAVRFVANRLPVPDVCYAHMWTSGYSIYKYARNNKIPLFVASGEDKIIFHKYLHSKTQKSFRDYLSGVICVSTKNLNESVRCGFANTEKCIVLPNGVEESLFYKIDKNVAREELGYSINDFIVIFVGRFYNRKGVNRVSEAISILNDTGIKSIFIGTNNPGENMQPNCGGILYVGKVAHDEIPKYLNAADVFVLPSLAEGCSNAIVEAMACGLPIISSDRPFNYDILDDKNSILIDPLDVTAIADSIKYLKDNQSIRETMSNNSILKAKQLTISTRTSNIIKFIISKVDEVQ